MKMVYYMIVWEHFHIYLKQTSMIFIKVHEVFIIKDSKDLIKYA